MEQRGAAANRDARPIADARRRLRPNPAHEDGARLAAVAPARQESEQDQCSICLDDFDDATFVGTIKECGHKFCVRCVTTHVHKTMVNGHVLCPLCRTAFNPRSVRKARQ